MVITISLKSINPHYSRIFYSKAKLYFDYAQHMPAIIENTRNLFSSKSSYSSFTKKPLCFPILPCLPARQIDILTFHNENP